MKLVTSASLAAALSAELERDAWGDIDPHWLKRIAETGPHGVTDEEEDQHETIEELRRCLARVAGRLNQ